MRVPPEWPIKEPSIKKTLAVGKDVKLGTQRGSDKQMLPVWPSNAVGEVQNVVVAAEM